MVNNTGIDALHRLTCCLSGQVVGVVNSTGIHVLHRLVYCLSGRDVGYSQ